MLVLEPALPCWASMPTSANPSARAGTRPSARACVKRQRPSWWTQEEVLARLQQGQFIGALCQQASEEMAGIGVVVGAPTLRAEFGKWCESATWGEQLRTALGMWKKTSSGEMALSKHWHDDFLAAMEVCEGNAERAAKMAGVGYGIVLSVIERRNKCYDADFAERFRVAEMQRIGRVREKYIDLAENGEGKAAVRAQERLIEAALPSVHGTRQEVHVSGNVQHEHEHRHGMSQELAEQVVRASQDRVRKITAGRDDRALSAADTIDSERVIDLMPIQQRQRQEAPA